MKFLVILLLFASCQKNYQFKKSDNQEQMICLVVENCSSSLNKETSDYLPPFKMLGDSPYENIDNIEKVSLKYGFNTITKNDFYLHTKLNNINLEFFVDLENKYILVKAQLDSTNWLGNKSFNLIESIRFDFFQKNY